MQLEHSFSVPVGIDDAWRILLDIERIGPCLPGATIDSVDGDEFTGTVKVKLGPINLTYKGKAGFVEKDAAAHRAVIDAKGRDARGNGTAAAKVTATLTEADGATAVRVNTDLDITGKPAQFGRGVMVDVGNKLIGQFADCLAATLSSGAGAATAPAAPAAEASAPAGEGGTAGAPPAGAGKTRAGKSGTAKSAATKSGAAKAGSALPPAQPPGTTVFADVSDAPGTSPTTKPTAGEAEAAAGAPAKRARPKPARPAAPPDPQAESAAESRAPEPPTQSPDEPTTEGTGEAPAAPSAAADAAGTAGTAAAADTTGAADAPPTTPAYSAPGGIPAAAAAADGSGGSGSGGSVNGHAARSSQPRHEAEPIDLLQSAGPAVAKRLAPVAVALLFVLVAVRRRHGRRA